MFCATHVHIRPRLCGIQKREETAEQYSYALPYLVDRCIDVKVDILFMHFQGMHAHFSNLKLCSNPRPFVST